jgi:hypothetical protein
MDSDHRIDALLPREIALKAEHDGRQDNGDRVFGFGFRGRRL